MTQITSAAELANALGDAKSHGNEWTARCPAHDDSNPSLWFRDGENAVVLFCHAGCSQEEVLSALKKRDIFISYDKAQSLSKLPRGIPPFWPPASILKRQGLEPNAENRKAYRAHWTYRDPSGEIVGHIVRYEGHGKKDIIPFFNKFDEHTWKSGHASKTERMLYGLDVVWKFPELPIIVVEGEKCTDAINKLDPAITGVTAVSWPGGAKAGNKCDWSSLPADAKLILWPDWDEAGFKAMDFVAQKFQEQVTGWIDSRFYHVGDAPIGYDVADLFSECAPEKRKDLLQGGIKLACGKRPDIKFPKEKKEKQAKPEAKKKSHTAEPAGEAESDDLPSLIPSSGSFPHTDYGNALRFLKKHRENVLFTEESGWLVWNGQRWVSDKTSEIKNMSYFIGEEIARDAAYSKDKAEIQRIIRFGQSSQNINRINAMLDAARSLPGVTVDYNAFDADPWLLNCTNGVVDLRSGKITPHAREGFISKLCPIDYEPEAECPLWLAFLERVMRQKSDAWTQDLVSYIRRAVGYSLTGSCREQCLFFLWGNGSNGKSVFLETLKDIFGDYSMATSTDLIIFKKNGGEAGSNMVARLKGARLVVGSELPQHSTLNEAKVKEMTGQDTMSARFLYREYFDFKPQFKLWIRCNDRPTIRGQDHGIWRRIQCIPFDAQITEIEKDPELRSKLSKELPGILAWCVQGAIDWYKNGLEVAPSVRQATQVYRKDMDSIGEWLEDYCIVEERAEVSSKVLYESYFAWCEEQNEKPLSQRSLGLNLRERHFLRVKREEGRFYTGLRLKQVAHDQAFNRARHRGAFIQEEMI